MWLETAISLVVHILGLGTSRSRFIHQTLSLWVGWAGPQDYDWPEGGKDQMVKKGCGITVEYWHHTVMSRCVCTPAWQWFMELSRRCMALPYSGNLWWGFSVVNWPNLKLNLMCAHLWHCDSNFYSANTSWEPFHLVLCWCTHYMVNSATSDGYHLWRTVINVTILENWKELEHSSAG